MADEQIVSTSETVNETVQVADNNLSTSLQASAWDDNPTIEHGAGEANIHQEEVKVDKTTAAATAEADTEVLDPNTYVKNKWGWDNEEVADNEIKTLREKAEKAFEYKNGGSKLIAEYINEGKENELYEFLSTRKKLDKLSAADLSDKNIAAELVKFGIQKDNEALGVKLSADEIEFIFNDKYAIPEKPIEDDYVNAEQYKVDLEKWQNQVSNIEKRLSIDAKIQQPKLSQLKSELVLPQIQKEVQNSQPQPTQEELAAFQRDKESFLQSAEKSMGSFNGFSYQVKNKDVDYTVSYNLSNEEKTIVDGKLKQFVNSGFDANALFADKWVEADGKTLKVEQMVKDLSRLYAGDLMAQKIAADSADKRLEAYLKEKKQIDLSGTVVKGTFAPNGNQTDLDRVREQAFA